MKPLNSWPIPHSGYAPRTTGEQEQAFTPNVAANKHEIEVYCFYRGSYETEDKHTQVIVDMNIGASREA